MSANKISKVLGIPYMTVLGWTHKAGEIADRKVKRELEDEEKES